MSVNPIAKVKIVRPKRLYEQIAEQIEAFILSKRLEPGTRLPPERELAEMLGVSRPSVREALIALETAGHIEVRTGDGTFVRGQNGVRPIFSLAESKDYGPGPVEQFEARAAIEPACAELAAQYGSLEQIDALEASLGRMRELVMAGENPAEEHRLFHTLLAEMSGNTILATAVGELWRLRQGELWTTLRKQVEHPESWYAGLDSRRELIARLRAHDGKGARAELERHFMRMRKYYFGKE